MKKIIIFLLVASASLSISGCRAGSRLIKNGVAALDGVTVTLKDVSISVDKQGKTVVESQTEIANKSKDGIMVVKYNLICLDKDGNELYTSQNIVYNGQNQAIAPGKSVTHDDRFSHEIEGEVSAVSIRLTETKTEAEVPPIHLPVAGEFLYEALNRDNLSSIKSVPPAKIVVGIDRGGDLREAVFSDADSIADAVELFTAIKIGDETYTVVTDNYNYTVFTWDDGSITTIRLNLHSLEVSVYNSLHYYELTDLDGFWSLAGSIAK